MKDKIDLFDRPNETLQNVINRGYASRTLRDNPIFTEAVKDVYWKLTLAEDGIMADMTVDGRKAAEESKRIAKMRALLADIVLVLDGNILEGENAAYEMENKL